VAVLAVAGAAAGALPAAVPAVGAGLAAEAVTVACSTAPVVVVVWTAPVAAVPPVAVPPVACAPAPEVCGAVCCAPPAWPVVPPACADWPESDWASVAVSVCPPAAGVPPPWGPACPAPVFCGVMASCGGGPSVVICNVTGVPGGRLLVVCRVRVPCGVVICRRPSPPVAVTRPVSWPPPANWRSKWVVRPSVRPLAGWLASAPPPRVETWGGTAPG
jgi:hypothetical protein